jgi:hypothetical protein
VTWVLVDRELNFANPEIRIAGMVAAMTEGKQCVASEKASDSTLG